MFSVRISVFVAFLLLADTLLGCVADCLSRWQERCRWPVRFLLPFSDIWNWTFLVLGFCAGCSLLVYKRSRLLLPEKVMGSDLKGAESGARASVGVGRCREGTPGRRDLG